MSYKCPICGVEVVEDYHDYLEYTLCEAADHCSNGCYSSNFSYGHFTEQIGLNTWAWSHNENDLQYKARKRQMAIVIAKIKAGNVNFVLAEEHKLRWQESGF